MLKVYNSLTRQREDFVPADPPHVNLSRNIRALIEEAFGHVGLEVIFERRHYGRHAL